MSAWAVPGVKCVCVDTEGVVRGFVPTPVQGETYTISAIEMSGGRMEIELEELPPPDASGNWYPLRRFRPLITKTQSEDVALFRHILDGLPIGENA